MKMAFLVSDYLIEMKHPVFSGYYNNHLFLTFKMVHRLSSEEKCVSYEVFSSQFIKSVLVFPYLSIRSFSLFVKF